MTLTIEKAIKIVKAHGIKIDQDELQKRYNTITA